LETSSEFARYEEIKLTEVDLSDSELPEGEATKESPILGEAEKPARDISLVDSTENKVEDLVSEASTTIASSITNSKSIKRTNYFMESRLNTTIEREKIVELLNEMINNEMTDENNRKAANDHKLKLIDIMNKEKIIENLIKAKGFEEALVFITDNSVNVIVEAEKITDSDMAKILDIVMRETKVPFDNIKILNKF
jgi:stage III sporulation protein AH